MACALGQIKVYIYVPGVFWCFQLCAQHLLRNWHWTQISIDPTAATIITTTTTATVSTAESTVEPGSAFTSSTGNKSSESLHVFRTPSLTHHAKNQVQLVKNPSTVISSTSKALTSENAYSTTDGTPRPEHGIWFPSSWGGTETEHCGLGWKLGEGYRFTGRDASIGGNEYAKHQASIWDMLHLSQLGRVGPRDALQNVTTKSNRTLCMKHLTDQKHQMLLR